MSAGATGLPLAHRRIRARLQARFYRLVRKFGGPKNKGARKRAIIAIAHTLLKIAYAVLKTGKPYQEPGTDFYTRRESAQAREEYLLRQLQKLNPAASSPSLPRRPPDSTGRLIPGHLQGAAPPPAPPTPADGTNRRRLLPHARKNPNYVSAVLPLT